ncbi:hypothetical protein [uncultured Microbacterium sp.]|uniref:lipopolysaccharide biosynthesis protein n=1 Tax=uncultured Microbacterium sp. TaxID=191216 RepID=UPI0025F0A62B|nr:hypothetical protein [uncultured Microbacterium sp.]
MRAAGPGLQAALLTVANGGSQALLAVAYVIAARTASPDSFGFVASAIGVGMAMIGIVDFGANSFWMRSLASGRMTLSEAARRGFWKTTTAVVLGVLTLLASLVLPLPEEFLAVAPVFLSMTLAQLTQVPLRAAARSDLIALSIGISRVIMCAALLVMLLVGLPSTTALWISLAFAGLLESILYLWLTPKRRRYRLDDYRFINPWHGSAHFGIYSVATSFQSLDVSLVTSFGGAPAGGVYAAVNRWTQPLGLAVTGFTSAAAPFIASAKSFRAGWDVIRRAWWMLGVALAACVIAFALAPLIVPLLLGEAYADSVLVFQIMAIGTIPGLLTQPLAVFGQMRGADRAVGILTAAGIAVRLLATAALAAAFGAAGGALAYALSQAVLVVALGSVFARAVREEGDQ